MDVGMENEPGEGEVIIFTAGGGFQVRGTMLEVGQRITGEEWPTFELAETGDKIMIRSDKVVALRGGSKRRRSTIGLTPHKY